MYNYIYVYMHDHNYNYICICILQSGLHCVSSTGARDSKGVCRESGRSVCTASSTCVHVCVALFTCAVMRFVYCTVPLVCAKVRVDMCTCVLVDMCSMLQQTPGCDLKALALSQTQTNNYGCSPTPRLAGALIASLDKLAGALFARSARNMIGDFAQHPPAPIMALTA